MKKILLAAALGLAGCNFNPVKVVTPTTALPELPQPGGSRSGAIFDDAATFRPLFEDRRARYVGDTLTITLNERLQASRNASSNASRESEISAAVPVVNKFPNELKGAAIQATSSNTFEGKGGSTADNLFTGTIAVTVVRVLSNGNLVVSGEKQIGIGQNSERLRFSGTVNPNTILSSNTVSSVQIADARIDHSGSGYIAESQTMGFLSRFFLTFLPF